ncbi:uncharacterized protein LOC143816888 [Ranitomeya variabilis]|uniref:uncharacterized protein LOC143816888 n=1 Tax=Ranitomeya variabilis TaxID=490064 RepID=UPI0040559C89
MGLDGRDPQGHRTGGTGRARALERWDPGKQRHRYGTGRNKEDQDLEKQGLHRSCEGPRALAPTNDLQAQSEGGEQLTYSAMQHFRVKVLHDDREDGKERQQEDHTCAHAVLNLVGSRPSSPPRRKTPNDCREDRPSAMIAAAVMWCLLAGSSAVVVIQDPPVLSVSEGQSAVMSCEIREDEDQQIIYYYWYLNNTHHDRILVNGTRVTIMSSTLIISPVTADDSGLYICTVRDSNVQSYRGNGTHLLVQESTESTEPHDNNLIPDKYLYCFLFIIPLVMVILIYWRFTYPPTSGAKAEDRKRRDKKRWRKKDNDEELLYATIFLQPRGAQTMEQMKTRNRREEVEYASVKIATPSLSLLYTPETSSTDNVLYPTLKTEES